MFAFLSYLKATNSRVRLRVLYLCLAISATALAAATYVRPISYYLGFTLILFIFYANRNIGLKRCVVHALVFALILYSLLGAWQVRNYLRCNDMSFSSVGSFNLSSQGLFGSYTRNTDTCTKGMAPFLYYCR